MPLKPDETPLEAKVSEAGGERIERPRRKTEELLTTIRKYYEEGEIPEKTYEELRRRYGKRGK